MLMSKTFLGVGYAVDQRATCWAQPCTLHVAVSCGR